MGRRRGQRPQKDQRNAERWYKDIKRENEMFARYYKLQKMIPDEEWDQFMGSLIEPLPATFRITSYRSQKDEILKMILAQINKAADSLSPEDKKETILSPLPWYPDKLGWKIDLSRQFIRRSEELKKFHQFLIFETECGMISRQEAVSMIPPILLDVKSHHKVLDMCAAPGSKTAQLIEMLHDRAEARIPEGFVVANDVDYKRCYMLVHQSKRLLSPSCIIVNHDASRFPNILMDKETGATVAYDRILCDVPCTGDGTLRKNIDVWKKWNTANAHNITKIQYRILKRGIELLAVGGRLVYSTCSMNPVEDEAIVAKLLRMAEGAVELVDVASFLPNLKYSAGLSHWQVMSREGEVFESLESVPKNLRKQIDQNMFPPENPDEFHLERCIRVLPHHQDTGGFFVALLEKKAVCPWQKKKVVEVTEVDEDEMDEKKNDVQGGGGAQAQEHLDDDILEAASPGDARNKRDYSPPRKRPKFARTEDPYVFFESERHPILTDLKNFYHLLDSFPMESLFTRSHLEKKRHIYMVNTNLKKIVENNADTIRIVNMGVRVFTRCTPKDRAAEEMQFRVTQDGIDTVRSYVAARVVDITRDDIFTLLMNDSPVFGMMSEMARGQIASIEPGSVVLQYDPDREENRSSTPRCMLYLCGWRATVSVRAFIARNETLHILHLCGATDEQIATREEYYKSLKQSGSKKGGSDDENDDADAKLTE